MSMIDLSVVMFLEESVVNAKTQIVYDFIALVLKNWAIADPNVNVGTA